MSDSPAGMDEFDLIDLIREMMPATDPDVLLGIGDDCAQLRVPPGLDLVATTDTLNAGVHFQAAAEARTIGHKALAASLSDVASMGAEPRWALLNLVLPHGDSRWVRGFVAGFASLARRHGVDLVGGDTTRGPLGVTVTVLGLVETGKAMRRSDAHPGDLVVVSGTLGDAALALQLARSGQGISRLLQDALDRPDPRVELGRALGGTAHACIDLSDGLLADLGHVASASACAAEIRLERLPASAALGALTDEERWPLQLAGGDDYELCFTLAPDSEHLIDDLSATLGLPLTVVGRMASGSGVRCLAPDGTMYDPGHAGYDHFQQRD